MVRRREVSDVGREDIGERLGHDRAVAGLRVGASAHQNERFRQGAFLQAVNTAPHVPRQNVQGRVSPSEEGEQEGGTTGANAPVHDGRSASQSSAGLRTNAQVRLHPLFLSFSLRRRDAGVEVSARVHASPLSSMASSLWPCQNVPGRVSPSEEGEQEGGTTGRQPPRRRQVYRPAILCTSPHQRTGFPLFLSFSLRRRDSGAEVSAPAGVSPLPSMVSRIWPCQNVPGRVSPSEEGDQEGGTTGANAPVHDGRSTGNPLQDSEPMPRSTSIPSSCPSPSGEGTQGRRFLLWFRCRLSRRWHLGSDPGRTFRARSLPQRRETKREGQPTRTLRATTGAAPAILCTSPHQRTGLPYPLFLFFSLRRRDAGVEVSALV